MPNVLQLKARKQASGGHGMSLCWYFCSHSRNISRSFEEYET